MTELKIDISEAIRNATRTLSSMVESRANSSVSNTVERVFYNGKLHNHDGSLRAPEGLGHEIIRKKVEDLVLSDKFQEIIDRIIDEELEGQARSAVKVLLHSQTRKHLFVATDPKSTTS